MECCTSVAIFDSNYYYLPSNETTSGDMKQKLYGDL